MNPRIVLVMRHAKSDWGAAFSHDRERPLNDRGLRSAAEMGRAITAAGLAPDRVLTSPAVRAATTARLAAEAGGWELEPEVVDRFYGGGIEDVIAEIEGRAAPIVMAVGHQPIWSGVVERLTGAREIRMATAAVAAIEVNGYLDRPGTLLWFGIPRAHDA